MRMRILGLAGCLAAAWVLVLAASTWANNLDQNEMGSLLVLPVVTGDRSPINDEEDIFTLVTVTNGKESSIRLVVDVVSGDDGTVEEEDSGGEGEGDPPLRDDRWRSTSFTCDLTGGETTTFVFAPGNYQDDDGIAPDLSIGGSREGSAVFVECSDGDDTSGDPKALFTDARVGVVVIAAADPVTGNVLSQDVLLGDAVVADAEDGEAYSFGAIPFQAGLGQNNGDKIYKFDGMEYARFPGVLATNFIAPTDFDEADSDLSVNAELILFTLDGSLGTTEPPRVRLGGFGYNDDEQYFDFQHEFDCFDIVALEDLDPNFQFFASGLGLGSVSGHLRMVSQPTATGNDAHDDQYGDGNDTRRRGVHGWLIQSLDDEHTLLPGDQPIPGTPRIAAEGDAAWGRPLSQSRTSLVPFQGDQDTVLDADVRN